MHIVWAERLGPCCTNAFAVDGDSAGDVAVIVSEGAAAVLT